MKKRIQKDFIFHRQVIMRQGETITYEGKEYLVINIVDVYTNHTGVASISAEVEEQ